MKKIIPYFTNIYEVLLYMTQENKFCIAYSANSRFSKNRKREKLADMPKLEFTDIDSANLCLATKIYPNIDTLNGTVENVTVRNDDEEDAEEAGTGGSGKQYYFGGNKNMHPHYSHYYSFWMPTEHRIREQILTAHKKSKIR